jgi:Flp pilus assembly protein TadG
MRKLFSLIGRLRNDQHGNVAVIFVLALVPLLSAIGCAIDYTRATQIQSKLQAAADAASVGSIAKLSPAFVAAGTMSSDGSIQVGVDDATKIFKGNMAGTAGFTLASTSPTVAVTKTGIRIASNVQFSADVPTMFLGVMGKSKMTVTGTSSSVVSLPPYLDFYLMLDVSGSMGLPSTDAEQTRLAAINPDNRATAYPGGCTLACHFQVQNVCGNGGQQYPTNNYCMGYAFSRLSQSALSSLINQASTVSVPKARPGLPNAMLPNLNATLTPGASNSLITGNPSSLPYSLTAATSCPTDGTDACIQLRADAVGYAVNQLFITANSSAKVTNQFRIGLYPFVQHLYAYFALTSAINGSPTNSSTINYAAANLASQLDTNSNASLGSGGTHIDNALTDMNNLIVSVGNGSTSTNTQPFIFLVTDGAQDNQTKTLNTSGGWSGSNHATVIDPTQQCQTIKNRGIIISVLYIPYQPIQNPNASFAGNEDGYANSNIASIPPSLRGCASPNFFFTANAPADITAALNAMFNQALVTAHITN